MVFLLSFTSAFGFLLPIGGLQHMRASPRADRDSKTGTSDLRSSTSTLSMDKFPPIASTVPWKSDSDSRNEAAPSRSDQLREESRAISWSRKWIPSRTIRDSKIGMYVDKFHRHPIANCWILQCLGSSRSRQE